MQHSYYSLADYSEADFSRRRGSRDKKKRKSPVRNSYGLTSDQVKQGHIETRNSAIRGGTIGLAATALPAYASRKWVNSELTKAKAFHETAVLPTLKNRSAIAIEKLRRGKLLLPIGVLGTGMWTGVAIANGRLASKRGKKAKAYRGRVLGIKKGYRINTKEKYNFWHHV